MPLFPSREPLQADLHGLTDLAPKSYVSCLCNSNCLTHRPSEADHRLGRELTHTHSTSHCNLSCRLLSLFSGRGCSSLLGGVATHVSIPSSFGVKQIRQEKNLTIARRPARRSAFFPSFYLSPQSLDEIAFPDFPCIMYLSSSTDHTTKAYDFLEGKENSQPLSVN